MQHLYRYFLVSLISCVAACATTQKVTSPESLAALTQREARQRSNTISDIHYDLKFFFQEDTDEYRGETTLHFDYSNSVHPLRIDYRGKKIESILIDDNPIFDFRFNGHAILIPRTRLKSKNRITIIHTSTYSRDGNGLHGFIDPEDRNTYLWTQFEIFEANQVFPCFDQPDLKATYQMEVTAPKEWTVITNTPAIANIDHEHLLTHQFAKTKLFSTYLVGLMAGPYVKWEDPLSKEIPLRIFARQSLAKYIDIDNLFTVTRQGFEFFEEYFGVPYPFAKYDQIFIPEFNWGGMENVGAVTLNERYIFRQQATRNKHFKRANLILHELAHMWFGNLVTMQWWDNLWLNESFATYMATSANFESTRFKEAWREFHNTKRWGFATDEYVTTHPIQGTIHDTDEALYSVDGITYGKGAAALKQLAYYVGESSFQKGLRLYFQRHAWKNTRLEDFMQAIEDATLADTGIAVDLSNWTDKWLRTSSMNTITPSWNCRAGKIIYFDILQEAVDTGQNTLRPHHTEVALFYYNPLGKLIAEKSLPVTYSSARTSLKHAIGLKCPDFVFANYNDYGYGKFYLDARSLQIARASIDKITDNFTRQMLWSTLWQMVRDQQIRADSFLELVMEKLPANDDLTILNDQLTRMRVAYWHYLPAGVRDQHVVWVERFINRRLSETKADSDSQRLWFEQLIHMTASDYGLKQLSRFLSGERSLKGLNIAQDLRWQLIQKLVAFQWPNAKDLIDAESQRDASDLGRKKALTAMASQADPEIKQAFWSRFLTDKQSSLDTLQAAMNGFSQQHQTELMAPFVGSFFEQVPQIFAERKLTYYKQFVSKLYPYALCNVATFEASKTFIKKHKTASKAMMEPILEAHQNLERCLKVRALEEQI